MVEKRNIMVFVKITLILAIISIIPNLAMEVEAKTIEMKYVGFHVPSAQPSIGADIWAEEIEKRTNGRVKIIRYHGATLGKLPDFAKMVKAGTVQMAFCASMVKGMEWLSVLGLPGLSVNPAINMDTTHALIQRGVLKFGLEDAGFKFLFAQPTETFYLHFVNKKPTKVSELKDMKLRGTSPTYISFLKILESVPVFVGSPDVYLALSRGTVDGLTSPADGVLSFKWYEGLKYCLAEPLASGGGMAIINLEFWNSLPADIRLIMEEVNEWYRYRFLELIVPEEQRFDELRKAGMEVYRFSPDEREIYQSKVDMLIDEEVKKNEGMGIPAKKMVQEIRKVVSGFKR